MENFLVNHNITNNCDYYTEAIEFLFENLFGRNDEIHC